MDYDINVKGVRLNIKKKDMGTSLNRNVLKTVLFFVIKEVKVWIINKW
jgi:hypothetical protein